jgi:hypothetical protein
MKWTVKLVAETAPGAVTEHDLLTLERPDQLTLARLGLSVEETKQPLAWISTDEDWANTSPTSNGQ